MYRDEPLDDEAELRHLVGEEAVDRLIALGGTEALLSALDALRILQGWLDGAACATWLQKEQRRLGGLSPLDALAAGLSEDVSDAVRVHIASQA